MNFYFTISNVNPIRTEDSYYDSLPTKELDLLMSYYVLRLNDNEIMNEIINNIGENNIVKKENKQ